MMTGKQVAIKLLFLFILLCSCEGKRKYWVYFDPQSQEQEIALESANKIDLTATQILNRHNVDLIYYSKWLNAATVLLTKTQLDQLETSKFILSIQAHRTLNVRRMSDKAVSYDLSFALEQIEGNAFVKKGLTGEGIKVGLIDGGFLAANKHESLDHIFENDGVKAYIDYVTPKMPEYDGSKAADDGHGTDVWIQLAGIHDDRKVQFGLAPKADFYLARTDDGRKEYKMEEEFFIRALEWMNERKVKVVNISLGYSTGFDDPDENYAPRQVDGQTAAATKAASIAVEKGMLLVVSAGNDGGNDFKVLSIPADSEGVISVGSTNFKVWEKAQFSSIGPQTLPYLKPNVSCFSSEGTSFSAPVIAGLAACMWQIDSTLSNHDIKKIIERSGHLYPFGNNYIGYGVPSCRKIFDVLNSRGQEGLQFETNQAKIVKRKKATLKFENDTGTVVIFHKTDSIHVSSQLRDVIQNGKITISRPKGISHSTIAFGHDVREIEWK